MYVEASHRLLVGLQARHKPIPFPLRAPRVEPQSHTDVLRPGLPLDADMGDDSRIEAHPCFRSYASHIRPPTLNEDLN